MNLKTSMYGLLYEEAKKYKNNRAMYFKGNSISYEDFMNRVDRLAAYLEDIGITKDDCVSVCMPNIPQTIYAIYAVNRIGAKLSIIHPLTPCAQLKGYLEHCDSKYLMILDISYKHFKELTKSYQVIVASIVDDLPFIKGVACGLTIKKERKEVKNANVLMFNKMNEYEPSKNEYSKEYQASSVYLHSSGTTGKPKTIELSNYAVNAVAHQSFYIMQTNTFEGTSMLTILPMFHGFGLTLNAHNVFIGGGTCSIMPKFNIKEVRSLLNKNLINYIVGVPSLFEALLKDKKFVNNPNIKNIIQTFVGGDFAHPTLQDRFNALLKKHGSNARLLEGYGLTETVTVNCVNRASDERKGSVGKPLLGYKMKIVDLETKKELGPNQDGEIIVTCDAIMNGYLKDEETTNQVLKKDENGVLWVYTGDLGYMDEDGYLYLKSRLKRVIKVSGVPVFPSEVEKVVSSLKEIDKACAVSMKDEEKGFMIKLYVTTKSDVVNKDELTDKIYKLCKEKLIRYALPKKIIYLDEMPLTPFNKIDYRSLEAREDD